MTNKISLEQFIAEIETTFSNYADTNDIDHQSIKTWVIQGLRKFGKNICEKGETIVHVKNKRALLPETFKSLTLAIKVETQPFEQTEGKTLVNEKRYIQNPAIWDSNTQQYIVNYCDTFITTEQTFLNKEPHYIYDLQPLSLEEHINKDTLDVDCFNLLPQIRNNYPNKISIVNRTLNTNFKEGYVYLKYNSLPEVDGEIAIPLFTTGEIYLYLENLVKHKLAEYLIANNKNATGLGQLYQTWKQEDTKLFVLAQGEAKSQGLSSDFSRKIYKQNLINRIRKGL